MDSENQNPTLESNSREVRNISYRVASAGMDLRVPGKRQERHLDTGDTISRAELLLVTRQKYIDIMLQRGDLEVME